MSAATNSKNLTQKDADQSIRASYNDVNATIGVDGFLVAAVGRRIAQAITTTTVPNDTAVFNFYENSGATTLYQITIVYTDGTRTTMLTATRTA